MDEWNSIALWGKKQEQLYTLLDHAALRLVITWFIIWCITSFAFDSKGSTLKSKNQSSPQANMKDRRTSVTSKVRLAAELHWKTTKPNKTKLPFVSRVVPKFWKDCQYQNFDNIDFDILMLKWRKILILTPILMLKKILDFEIDSEGNIAKFWSYIRHPFKHELTKINLNFSVYIPKCITIVINTLQPMTFFDKFVLLSKNMYWN